MLAFFHRHKFKLLIFQIGLLVLQSVYFGFISTQPLEDNLWMLALSWGLAVFVFFVFGWMISWHAYRMSNKAKMFIEILFLAIYLLFFVHNIRYFVIEQNTTFFMPFFIVNGGVAAVVKNISD